MVKCDVCKKRDALYYRTYSGHRLCTICLERILSKTVKRTIGESGLLTPGSRILAVVRPSEPMHSLASLLLLSIVESKFNVELHVLAPSQLNKNNMIESIVDRIGRWVKSSSLIEEFPLPKSQGPIHCIRYERAWALSRAKKLNADVIAFPLSRTCINTIGLEALLSSRTDALSEALPAIPWTRPPIFSPIANIEGEALSAYAFLKGLQLDPLCTTTIPAKIPLLSILGNRPELEFSSSKTIIKLSRKINTGYCELCGGYTRRGERICGYCIESGASLFFSRE
ncbi:MAG: hypothetical protein F7C38_08360 [Desulfurococcales archaeon]|nr:hypothetical protein [Desulfurococcales archaeon]